MRSPRRPMKSSSPSGASASTRSTRSTSKVRPRHLAGRCTLKPQDPHSPQVYGIHRVLWLGVVLYVEESAKPETVEHYGRGTPDDWIERNFYSGLAGYGVFVTLALAATAEVPRAGDDAGDAPRPCRTMGPLAGLARASRRPVARLVPAGEGERDRAAGRILAALALLRG